MEANTIFQRLLKGEVISSEDPENFKLKETSHQYEKTIK
jgi:hypothetical protein